MKVLDTTLLEGIFEWAKRSDSHIDFCGIVEKPEDAEELRQECEVSLFDHEYIDQYSGGGWGGDTFHGHVYLPVGDGRYVKLYYVC